MLLGVSPESISLKDGDSFAFCILERFSRKMPSMVAVLIEEAGCEGLQCGMGQQGRPSVDEGGCHDHSCVRKIIWETTEFQNNFFKIFFLGILVYYFNNQPP